MTIGATSSEHAINGPQESENEGLRFGTDAEGDREGVYDGDCE